MAKRKVKITKGVKRATETTKVGSNYKGGKVRHFTINGGLPKPEAIIEELSGYRDVLFSRELSPIDKGVMTLMEIAEGYFSRTCELEQLILEAKREGHITAKSPYHQIRTQELRSFKEMFKSAAELGSRRITFENLRFQQESRGLESL